MTQQVSYKDIEEDILQVLDKVPSTGTAVQIERKGKRLLISPTEKRSELNWLEKYPDFIVGNPDDLVHIDWSSAWKPEL